MEDCEAHRPWPMRDRSKHYLQLRDPRKASLMTSSLSRQGVEVTRLSLLSFDVQRAKDIALDDLIS